MMFQSKRLSQEWGWMGFEWMNGLIDGWMGGLMDGRMDGRVFQIQKVLQ